MAVRLKTKWHRSKRSERNRRGAAKPKTFADLSSVIAINIWKLAKEAFTHMEKEGFRFREDRQAISFMTEVVIYQIHIVDRMVYGKVSEEERESFLNALARRLAQDLAENQTDLFGEGEYISEFIETMNKRFTEYAECEFTEEGPGYAFTRYLGQNIADIMKESDDKWVKEQVMDVEAPQIVEKIMRVAEDVLGLRQR
jgi:hypothetical protein